MHTRHHRNRGALRKQRPYLRLSRFQGVRSLTRKENSGSGITQRHRLRLRYRSRPPEGNQSPRPGMGILTHFPFDIQEQSKTLPSR